MAVVELFNSVHEAQVAFLDQIEEVEGAIAAILFGDCDNQSEMSSHHFLARRRQRSPRAIHLGAHDPQVGDRKAYALSQRREVVLQGLKSAPSAPTRAPVPRATAAHRRAGARSDPAHARDNAQARLAG